MCSQREPSCRASHMNFMNIINSRSVRLFHLIDTNEHFSEIPGIPLKKSYHDKTRVKEGCEPVYARKLMNDHKLQFRGEERNQSPELLNV